MKSFEELTLNENIKKALTDLKFENMTEIQEKVLPVAMKGHDVMACAMTGSGKTAAYGLPMLTSLLEESQRNALVLAPTRELAQQIAEFLRQLSRYCGSFYVTSLVGGADIRKQIKALKRKPRILVATPGRLMDHIRRNKNLLNATEILVLDEGDRMIDMGFAPQLEEVLKFLPAKRQTLFFTATLPQKVEKLAAQYLHQPTKVDTGKPLMPAVTIKQKAIKISFSDKDDRIIDELNAREGSVIIFARTKNRTNILAKNLRDFGFRAEYIHSDRSQGQRNLAIRKFKEGKSRILCATDIAARGLDIPQVEHVINFDLPMVDEDYIHRIGRTGRNGSSGEALSFVMPEELRSWATLVKKYKIKGVDLGEPEKTSGRSKKKSGKKTTKKTSTRFKAKKKTKSKSTARPKKKNVAKAKKKTQQRRKASSSRRSNGRTSGRARA